MYIIASKLVDGSRSHVWLVDGAMLGEYDFDGLVRLGGTGASTSEGAPWSYEKEYSIEKDTRVSGSSSRGHLRLTGSGTA